MKQVYIASLEPYHENGVIIGVWTSESAAKADLSEYWEGWCDGKLHKGATPVDAWQNFGEPDAPGVIASAEARRDVLGCHLWVYLWCLEVRG